MKRKRALVTGSAGFIGSTLSERLLREGYEVYGIDAFVHNYDRRLKEQNLQGLLTNPQFHFWERDLRCLDFDELLSRVDVVFHQAALPGVRTSWGAQFQEYVDHNILVTQALLEAAKHSHVQKIVCASSSSVYGGMSGPTDETVTPQPVSPYGVTKLAAEQLGQLYANVFGVPVVSLRYFTVFGPRQRPDMAFHKFIKNVLSGEPIDIYGDGEQSRDFTFIDDAVTANLLAATSPVAGEVFNIGGVSQLTVNEVIALLETHTGKTALLRRLPEQPGDPRHTFADISKARQQLGYDPQFDIEKGIWLQIQQVRSLYNL
ncbi:UDP-glucose 4-epimerase [Tumebacillus sp. BK434]|uniref:NAD-dependent epimerase/dehydratase family protein n=1 Tax=Tumebacillus sp. BK434 TaxID=2512169 RepID=UPI00104E7839|nr:NAD-dependent epimerase/dehydratase family protein [Tumebacillus sp. BK434]TCP59432.1 UDP-glucose 4-epimerase [Tumebacillus sp. BK434]